LSRQKKKKKMPVFTWVAVGAMEGTVKRIEKSPGLTTSGLMVMKNQMEKIS
jgi:hypothetical protein